MRNLVFLAIVAVLISGCGGNQVKSKGYFEMPKPDAANLEPYLSKGTGTVTGQVFLRTKGGDSKFGAGEKVCLVPNIAYLSKRKQKIREGYFVADHASWEKAFKCAQADGDGRFKITGLGTANWVAESKVTWSVTQCGRYTGCYESPQGGYITKNVQSKDKEEVTVMMTR